MNIGITCGSVPYIAAFFRRHRLNLSRITSLRYLLVRSSSKRSKTDLDLPLDDFKRISPDASAPQKVRIETQVLRSIQGYVWAITLERFHGLVNVRR